MADIDNKRISEILRLVFDLLWFEPQGLYASEIFQYINSRFPLSEYEKGSYPFAPNHSRAEVILRVGTIPLSRAGWLLKDKYGRWMITDSGREACRRYSNPEEFFRESISLFLEWDQKEKERFRKLTSDPEGGYALETSWQQIHQYIDSLDLDAIHDLVSALLKALGCYIMGNGGNLKRSDELIDLVCFPDPLGIKQPRMLVHIANPRQVATIEGLSRFMSLLKPDDIGLFICFGGATTQLREFALTQTRDQIRLIDLDRFIEMWIENQDKIDREARALFPLKPVYFLSFPYG